MSTNTFLLSKEIKGFRDKVSSFYGKSWKFFIALKQGSGEIIHILQKTLT